MHSYTLGLLYMSQRCFIYLEQSSGNYLPYLFYHHDTSLHISFLFHQHLDVLNMHLYLMLAFLHLFLLISQIYYSSTNLFFQLYNQFNIKCSKKTLCIIYYPSFLHTRVVMERHSIVVMERILFLIIMPYC